MVTAPMLLTPMDVQPAMPTKIDWLTKRHYAADVPAGAIIGAVGRGAGNLVMLTAVASLNDLTNEAGSNRPRSGAGGK